MAESFERPIEPGDLVLDRDGYYALVVGRKDDRLLLALSNGLLVLARPGSLRRLFLKAGDRDGSHASFPEVVGLNH